MNDSGRLITPGQNKPAIGGNTGRLISSYYLEIEYLLDRVERSDTHYQTLGVERLANNEEIIIAYHNAVAALHPSYYKVRAAVPDDLFQRIDRAFGKVSQAFFVLTTSEKRIEYDRSLNRRSPAPLPIVIPDSDQLSRPATSSPQETRSELSGLSISAQQAIAINTPQSNQTAFTKLSSEHKGDERRRCERLRLSIPALVAGHDRKNGKWQEMTKTFDVSLMGLGIRLHNHVRHGSVLHVVLPMPVKLRKHGHSDPAYNAYAIVRRIEPPDNGARIVGLEFLGEHPPAGYIGRPWATFRSQKWSGTERRREPRQELAALVEVEFLNEEMKNIRRTIGVTENVSSGGMRICLKAAPAAFDWVKVHCPNRKFKALASVRNRYIGKEGHVRLCLQFLDNKWPL